MREKAFVVAPLPRLWNCIPLEIKIFSQSFREKIKTLYFDQAFPSKILCVPACLIDELEQETDNDKEPNSDLQHFCA